MTDVDFIPQKSIYGKNDYFNNAVTWMWILRKIHWTDDK